MASVLHEWIESEGSLRKHCSVEKKQFVGIKKKDNSDGIENQAELIKQNLSLFD